MYVLSLVILLIFCIQLGIHGNLKIDDVNFGECGQAYRGMLKVLENDWWSMAQERIELFSWRFCVQLGIYGIFTLILPF